MVLVFVRQVSSVPGALPRAPPDRRRSVGVGATRTVAGGVSRDSSPDRHVAEKSSSKQHNPHRRAMAGDDTSSPSSSAGRSSDGKRPSNIATSVATSTSTRSSNISAPPPREYFAPATAVDHASSTSLLFRLKQGNCNTNSNRSLPRPDTVVAAVNPPPPPPLPRPPSLRSRLRDRLMRSPRHREPLPTATVRWVSSPELRCIPAPSTAKVSNGSGRGVPPPLPDRPKGGGVVVSGSGQKQENRGRLRSSGPEASLPQSVVPRDRCVLQVSPLLCHSTCSRVFLVACA